ncbi:CD1247 N-terminal domain-containing protein [Mechercharimyces sp. CAU 1602]|uniref:CD1247 N-terminal domain-containing protein n=1 Tax=Mechercharimyces sp. CAU 1602 TaxID=2973933 RepID=UPI0021612FE8|nr:CD1247 N-terminal domain-containing protein [Mechercharimyces sp. CAU 1602]MCS1350770.1 hypothetical protein [Mechercharimyces sp. CAU 1602]
MESFEHMRRELSYLHGMMDSADSNRLEYKVLTRLIGILDDHIDEVEHMKMRQTELEEYVEAVDEDLNDVEVLLYDENEEDFLEMECPECHQPVIIDEMMLAGEESVHIECPQCGEVLLVTDEDEGEFLRESESEEPYRSDESVPPA